MITFPADADWDVPPEGCHIDAPSTETVDTVRMFAYLNEVQRGGGGTLVIEVR